MKLGKSTELPPNISYSISRILNAIGSESKIYNEERTKLVNKYCDKDEEGKPIEIENNQVKITENMPIFIEKLQELQNTDVDIHKDKIELKIEQLPKGLLSAFDMMQLDLFFDIDGDKEAEVEVEEKKETEKTKTE